MMQTAKDLYKDWYDYDPSPKKDELFFICDIYLDSLCITVDDIKEGKISHEEIMRFIRFMDEASERIFDYRERAF